MKGNLLGLLLFACAVIFAIAAEVAEKKSSPVGTEVKGPIVGMMVASSIDDRGELTNPRFTFPTNEKQMTVAVQLGKEVTGPVNIAWYKKTKDGEEKIFEHNIDNVKSGERAYSVGKNPGRTLEAGTYKAVATVGGQKQEMQWNVAEKHTDTTQDAWPFKGSRPAPDKSGSVPQRAPSNPKPIDYTPLPSDCVIYLYDAEGYPSMREKQEDNIAPRVQFYCYAICGQPEAVRLSVAGADFGGFDAIVGDIRRPQPSPKSSSGFGLLPCVEGFADLPGSTIPAKAAIVGAGQEANVSIVLGQDTSPPEVKVIWTPPDLSKVKTGDKIKVQVTATEQRARDSWSSEGVLAGPWQSGIKKIEVRTLDPGPAPVDKPWENPASRESQACDGKAWEHQYEVTYTVPKNPPPFVVIVAKAEDYDKNQASVFGTFPTGDQWTGTLHGVGNAEMRNPRDGTLVEECKDEKWDVGVSFMVQADKRIIGTATGHRVSGPHCKILLPHATAPENVLNMGEADDFIWTVTGKLEGKEFQVELEKMFKGDGGGGYNPFFPQFAISVVGCPKGSRIIKVPLTSPKTAAGHGSLTCGPASGTVDVNLKCTNCVK